LGRALRASARDPVRRRSWGLPRSGLMQPSRLITTRCVETSDFWAARSARRWASPSAASPLRTRARITVVRARMPWEKPPGVDRHEFRVVKHQRELLGTLGVRVVSKFESMTGAAHGSILHSMPVARIYPATTPICKAPICNSTERCVFPSNQCVMHVEPAESCETDVRPCELSVINQ
jgi:hypothetical protein